MKKVLAAVGLVGACAVCCAPLLVPALAGTGLIGAGALGAGLLAGVPLEAIACAALPVLAVAAYAAWVYRRQKATPAPCACDTACSASTCAPGDKRPPRATA
ncbi:MAG: hypothetical protein HY855_20005 [Burkholderiales bacterium]|nr:hypothetical protein [Burkholderiales bacterium]